MLLILRHIHPALANIAGGIVGAGFVALGVTIGHSVFVLSGAVSVVLSVVHQPRVPALLTGAFVTGQSESDNGSVVDASSTSQRLGSI